MRATLFSMDALSIEQNGPADGLRERQTYRFGAHLLDVQHRILWTGSERRPLPEKLFRILVLLLEAETRVVPRHVFYQQIWRDEDVSVANLTQHVFMLRALLGERAGDNSYILTVPGSGYRLAMPVEKKAGLAMKGSCERSLVTLGDAGDAAICSFECTFCVRCADALGGICPNCGGELVKRPRRGHRNES